METKTVDCLLIGVNEVNFREFMPELRNILGTQNEIYRNMNIYFVEHNGIFLHALDLLNYIFRENNKQISKPLSNIDYLSPALIYLGFFYVNADISSITLIYSKLKRKN